MGLRIVDVPGAASRGLPAATMVEIPEGPNRDALDKVAAQVEPGNVMLGDIMESCSKS